MAGGGRQEHRGREWVVFPRALVGRQRPGPRLEERTPEGLPSRQKPWRRGKGPAVGCDGDPRDRCEVRRVCRPRAGWRLSQLWSPEWAQLPGMSVHSVSRGGNNHDLRGSPAAEHAGREKGGVLPVWRPLDTGNSSHRGKAVCLVDRLPWLSLTFSEPWTVAVEPAAALAHQALPEGTPMAYCP